MKSLHIGKKGDQIYHISVFKNLLHTYVIDETLIESLLMPEVESFVSLFKLNKGGDGIRVSALLALFVPVKYHTIAKEIVFLVLFRQKN